MHTHIESIADSPRRHSYRPGPEAGIIMGTIEPGLIRLPRGTGENTTLPASLIHLSHATAAHAEFVATLSGHPPQTIPLDADAIDLEDRANHLSEVFDALSVYVAVILDDTAQNAPGRLDLPDVEGILFDLASDVTGTIQHAAEGMGWRDA